MELKQNALPKWGMWKIVGVVLGLCLIMLFAVLALHVLVIAGFTAYHLAHTS